MMVDMPQKAHNKVEMVGKRIGRLTVIKDSGKRSWGSIVWICQCNCGSIVEVRSSSLRKKNPTQSCGCLEKEVAQNIAIDLKGKTFHRLTVLEKAYSKNDRLFWKCQCVCGKTCFARSDQLLSGHTQSCGCYVRELTSMRKGKMSPTYNPNITDEEREKGRFLFHDDLEQWRKSVFERDDYTCQICGKRGSTIHAHHLNGYHWDKNERFSIDNGVTLCKDCHYTFHRLYGFKNNTKEQFIGYKNNNKRR